MSLFEKLCGMLPPALSVTATVNKRFEKITAQTEMEMYNAYREFIDTNMTAFKGFSIKERDELIKSAVKSLNLDRSRVKHLHEYIEKGV